MTAIPVLKAIFISVGHGEGPSGGFDPGSIAPDKTTERQVVVRIAAELAKMLPAGRTHFIGGEGQEESVAEQTKTINDFCTANKIGKRESLLVSIHANAPVAGAAGTFAMYQSDDAVEKDFAVLLGDEVCKAAGTVNRPEQPDTASRFHRLGIVRDTIPTSALIECGFLSGDLQELKTSPEKFALGIKTAIEIFSGESFAPQGADEWAAKQADFLKRIGVWKTQNPRAPLSPVKLAWVLFNLGFLEKQPDADGISEEEFMVLICREGWYKKKFPNENI